jgi:hypothetical protein
MDRIQPLASIGAVSQRRNAEIVGVKHPYVYKVMKEVIGKNKPINYLSATYKDITYNRHLIAE